METSFGVGMDPAPFIAGAYFLGATLILGYVVWTVFERRRLTRLLAAIEDHRGDLASPTKSHGK